MDFKTLNKNTFDGHINSNFKFYTSENDYVELTLIEAEEKIIDPVHNVTLTFEGNKQDLLEDNIYKYEHDVLGSGDLFIKPFSEKNTKIYYDVVISKFVEGFDPN